jgi:deoxyribonuclease V
MNDFIYPYDLNLNLANIQNKLAKKVIKRDLASKIDNVVGVDVSFSRNDRAVAAAVIIQIENLTVIDESTREVDMFFPYVPGFLGFRESNAMISVLDGLKQEYDAIMVNGHGILHPRGFGLASQVGLLLDKPTIGVAKRLIVGNPIKVNEDSDQVVVLHGKISGALVNGYYVSIGHKISLKRAVDLVKETSIFKTSEPIRKSHILATATYKKIIKNK